MSILWYNVSLFTVFTGTTNSTTMKFIINKEALLDKLQFVLGPTTTKQNFPILNSVLITAEKNKIKLITTDLDITIISFQEANVVTEGEIAVPMKRFLSVIRELPTSEITVELVKNNLLIRCEKIEFKMSTLDSKEFPKINEENKTTLIKINPADLEKMIQLTSFCVGYEDASYVLSGIFFEIWHDKISLAATDGKRLSVMKALLPANQPEVKTKVFFTLPNKAVNEIYKLVKDREEEIFLFIEGNKIGIDLKHTQIISRPIEGEFPNYTQYIPQESKDKLIINRKNFLLALRRADLLSTMDYQGVKLELKKDSVIISKNTPQLGEAKEVVEAKYNGTPMEIGFNPNYIIDVLKNIEDEDVGIEFYSADKPAILRKDNYVYLVLPMKI